VHRIIVILGLILVASTPAQAEDLSTEFDRVTTASWPRTTGIDKLMRAGRYQKVLSLSFAKPGNETVKEIKMKSESHAHQ